MTSLPSVPILDILGCSIGACTGKASLQELKHKARQNEAAFSLFVSFREFSDIEGPAWQSHAHDIN